MNSSTKCAAAIVSAAIASVSAKAGDRILGTSVNYLYGSINWTNVAQNGVTYAYALATIGTMSEDPDYPTNMLNGKAAGLQMGPIHFAQPFGNVPSREANYFWNYAAPYILADGKTISPMVIFEYLDGYQGASSYTAWFNDWGADVKAKTSNVLHPIIYVTACSSACYLTTNVNFAGYIANYTGNDPYTSNPWTSCDLCNAWDPGGTGGWTFWQFTDSGHVNGISGDVDLSVYKGDLTSLKANEGVTATTTD
jgi:lysozyme